MKTAMFLSMLSLAAALTAGPALAQDDAAYDAAFEKAMELFNTDRKAAVALIEPMANAGHAEALNTLAMLVESEGPGWKADPKRAESLRDEAISRGSAAAALNKALRTIEEPDVDPARTIELIKLAEKDPKLVPTTAYLWGRLYLFGLGVERDMKKGVELLDMFVAYDQGGSDLATYANFLLGRAYSNGWGVERDDARAYRHFRLAAEKGEQRAQWQAAMMLLQGAGVEVDQKEAYRLVSLSSEQGYMAAIISRGVMLAMGEGVAENDAEARQWYEAAARQGSAHGLRALGGMLANGEGGATDAATGLAMLELAAEGGDEVAPQMIELLAPKLRVSREAIDTARASWLVRHGAPTGQ